MENNPGQYYEGILQLRTDKDSVAAYVEKEIYKSKEKVSVAKVVELKNGLDIYFSSNKFVRKMGKKLQKEFGGEVKVSRKLHTRHKQTSRLLYRVTVLFKPFEFLKGDVVVFNDKVIEIKSIGKTVTGIDLAIGKRTKVKPEKNVKVLEQKTTTVSKTYPGLEVLHPETYQSVEVENPKKLKAGKKVNVVEYKGKLFLL